jgi:hypothetical protein
VPNKNWDLDQIISESDQAEVAKITLASRGKEKMKRFLCRIGIHKYSSWGGVSMMAFQAQNEGTGESVRHDFELGMRCCFKCGRPGVRLRRI